MTPQRIVAPARGQIKLDSFDLPSVGPDQVLIETHYSAISPGTELAFLHNKPNTTGQYPSIPVIPPAARLWRRVTRSQP